MNISKEIETVLDQKSVYPDLPRKSKHKRQTDLERWYEKYGEVNKSYNLYGFDIVDFRNPDDYLDNGIFRKQRYEANSSFRPATSDFDYDFTVVLRDKRLFDSVFSRVLPGSVLPETLGYIIDGKIFFTKKDGAHHTCSINRFIEEYDGAHLAVKQTFGCHGANLISCFVADGGIVRDGVFMSIETFVRDISCPGGPMWIVQRWLSQHETLSAFNPSSVNALRILTYNTGNRVVVSQSALLVGPQGSIINNPEEGTETLFGINTDGVISNCAYSFAGVSRTPSVFSGTQIPFFGQACALVCEAHSLLPEVFSIGWDVVIGEDGPVLLEGNDGWSTRAIQFPNESGERRTWDELLDERRSLYAKL